MTIKLINFSRKPFSIKAVQVTADNMDEIAEWCDGEVRTEEHTISAKGRTTIDKYVKVYVHRPMNERQTKGYVSDWVLRTGNSFKVYTNKALVNNFDMISDDIHEDGSSNDMEELLVMAEKPADGILSEGS